MPITVDLVEELGSDEFIYGHAELDGGSERFVVRSTGGHTTPALGDAVHVKPHPERIHAFNAASGLRL